MPKSCASVVIRFFPWVQAARRWWAAKQPTLRQTVVGRMTLGARLSVTAEIYTGKRRIIGFLLSPLQRILGESGHER